jgi:outer membrane protein OmpA-like peptidoglycan-associated protein
MTRRALLTAILVLVVAPASAQPPSLIFFEPHSAALGDAADAILRAFADSARRGESAIEVLGFADPDGGIPYNRALSRARAEHVAHALRELGVPAGRVRIRARGPVTSVLDDQESRRVELRLLP